MKGYNHWSVIGNVGRDPELRFTPSGVAVATFTVAVNSSWKDAEGNKKEHVEWVNVVAWKGLAENVIAKYVKKGDPIFVEGRSQTRTYEKDGQTKYFFEMVATNAVLLGGKRDGETGTTDRAEPGQDAPPVSKGPGEEDLPF